MSNETSRERVLEEALTMLLHWHGGLPIPCMEFSKKYGMPVDNIKTLEACLERGKEALATPRTPTREGRAVSADFREAMACLRELDAGVGFWKAMSATKDKASKKLARRVIVLLTKYPADALLFLTATPGATNQGDTK